MDDFNRESLKIEIDTSLSAPRVVRALDQLIEIRGKPATLRLDNGPELISDALAKWANKNGMKLLFIQPGRPMQNPSSDRWSRYAGFALAFKRNTVNANRAKDAQTHRQPLCHKTVPN